MPKSGEQENLAIHGKEIDNEEEQDNSEAWSAVDYSDSANQSDESVEIQQENLITTEEIQAMLEQQNQKHQDIMRKQQEMFLMQINKHKHAMRSNEEQKSTSFQDNFNLNEENNTNHNNLGDNMNSEVINSRPHSQSIIIETK